MDEAYLSWRYVPRLFDHARYGSFSLRLSCASSRFHTVPSRSIYVRAGIYALSKAARVNLLQASCCERVNQSVVKAR